MARKPRKASSTGNDTISTEIATVAPVRNIPPEVRGYFETCDTTFVNGWVASGETDERLGIEVLADGLVVAEILADAFRPDLVAAKIGDGKHGFKVKLPIEIFDGDEHRIEVREKSTGLILNGSPKTFRAESAEYGDISGYFESCDESLVSGWVMGSIPGEKLHVEVISNGAPVAADLADVYREDLFLAKIGDGRHGFSIALPKSLYDGRPHSIEVREVTTGLSLTGSPKSFQASASAYREIATISDPRLDYRTELVMVAVELSAESTAIDTDEPVKPGEPVIRFDQVVGHTVHGWSVPPHDGSSELRISFRGKVLGKIDTPLFRSDVRDTLGLESDRVGFGVMIGGLLHFAALSIGSANVKFSQVATGGASKALVLSKAFAEAYTFAPLKSFSRQLPFPAPGIMRSARCFGDGSFSMLIEAGSDPINGHTQILVDFYQSDREGWLKPVGQFAVDLAGQLAEMEFELLDKTKPVLMVVTDAQRNFLVSDCVAFPEMFLERHLPLIEYHSLLAAGQPAFDVAAKISRGLLDFHLAGLLGDGKAGESRPHRANTQVMLFARDDFDALPTVDADSYRHVSDRVALLGRNGSVVDAIGGKGAGLSIAEFISISDAEFVLLCEVANVLRPDFWAILQSQADRLSDKSALVYWDSIWLEGTSRPYWVSNHMLCHAAFGAHSLAPINAVLINRHLLRDAMSKQPDAFASGHLRPEKAFHFVDVEAITHLPVVLDSVRLRLAPAMTQRFEDEQTPLPILAQVPDDEFLLQARQVPQESVMGANAGSTMGVSIVINYRNAPEPTIRCLQSIRLQDLDVPIEIILVNNGSTPWFVSVTVDAASGLFGRENVSAIDYVHKFNHSAQCNLAVAAARYDYVLMLSNDSVLVSPDAIMSSLRIATVPWVGSCGFRIVAQKDGKPSLQSVGLKLAETKYLFYGRAPLATNRPPRFCQNFTLETAGNTFASVMLRKSVYLEVGGLDEAFFPTDYNDVDFCMRATAKGFRHIVLGQCVVGHIGRGTREMNLDIPVSRKIMERVPPLAMMGDSFSIVQL